jgi:hypothetical protein
MDLSLYLTLGLRTLSATDAYIEWWDDVDHNRGGTMMSFVRAAVLAVAAGMSIAAGAAWAQQGAFTYAPGTQRYRVTTVVNRSQDQAGGRAPFEFAVTTTQYITLNLARGSHDTLNMTLTVDSVGVNSTLDALPPDTEGFRGVKLDGKISPRGHLYAFDPPPGTPPGKLTALYRAFRLFLVAFPATRIAPGTTWTDSSTDVMNRDPFKITSVRTTNWKVTGDTTIAGQKAWRIEGDGSVTLTGEGKQGSTPIQLTGDESIRAVKFFGTNGTYLGGTATQNNQIQMSMAETGEGGPIKQTIRSTVEPLSATRTAAQ